MESEVVQPVSNRVDSKKKKKRNRFERRLMTPSVVHSAMKHLGCFIENGFNVIERSEG